MKIAAADTAPPRGLENAIQRVQANIDRRAAHTRAPHAAGKTPGANALAQLQANLDRRIGGGTRPDPIEFTPVEPAPPAEPLQPDAVLPAPAPDPNTGAGALLDLLA